MVKEFVVDLNKPLVFQVGNLGEAYDEWVHRPILSKDSPRFFANDFIEWLSKCPWWVVPLVWLPVVWWFVLYPTRNGVAPTQVALPVIGGVLLWTFIEYCLHRFLFHIKTAGYWGNTIHYMFHGCHHKHPMDHLRLVLPPHVAALFIIFFWYLTELLTASQHSHALFGGELLGYVIYDCIHYHLHHAKQFKPGFSLERKKYHMNHHYGIEDKGFGVTSSFWDWVFGTLPSNHTKTAMERITNLEPLF